MRAPEWWPFPKRLYGQALYFAKGYDEMKKDADELIAQAPVMDGMPRSTKTGDPVFAAAIRRERIRKDISIIEDALLEIEPEYRNGVIENVVHGVPMRSLPGASESTWIRKRRLFLINIVLLNGWDILDDGWRQY